MILVTGITGLTGRFLYEQIQRDFKRDQVCYMVRESSDVSWMKEGERFVYGNLRDADDVRKALGHEGITEVLHLAPRNQLKNVLEACLQHGIQRIYYVNSTGIYSKFKSSSHIDLQNEQLLRASGLTYTIIRPSMICGNQQDGNIHMLVKIMKRFPVYPILGAGDGLMHPIYANDLAKVLVSMLNREELTRGQEYDVAGKAPLKYKELLSLIAGAMGKKIVFLHIPYKLALIAGRIGEKIPNRIINYEKVLRLNEDKNFDYSKAAKELDFKPIGFDEAIVLEVAALRKHGTI
ncbi:nucleoside-diphosphate sugar epimerase [Paenibacillus sp. BIHB 4019]|uniref:Nucleoside-diphosphate sugar epimerase n=1 Tax=Paenibacillus sp. BIHB 4019 TaxID=1870819 RepID=A0A1B2DF70_9BACL|nr:NAD-dependent epimerase/dehydratase family protein [Paenibacillus sp. BIHB 4019]ANY66363.1 nucleoside-diphosphate sugar epimerase [Paenibacillus sp. BIHB 4019]